MIDLPPATFLRSFVPMYVPTSHPSIPSIHLSPSTCELHKTGKINLDNTSEQIRGTIANSRPGPLAGKYAERRFRNSRWVRRGGVFCLIITTHLCAIARPSRCFVPPTVLFIRRYPGRFFHFRFFLEPFHMEIIPCNHLPTSKVLLSLSPSWYSFPFLSIDHFHFPFRVY